MRRALGGVVPLGAALVAFLFGAIMILALGANPLDGLVAMIEGAFGTRERLAVTAIRATPLLLVGTGITVAFRARVINIGSVDGLKVPELESYSYSASKAAVHMLTRHLAKRLAPEHITVNAIAPGPFDSKMMAFALDDPQARAGIAAGVPLGRIGEPDDMAGAAIYLASRAGCYLTGAVVPVSGGIACAD